jgi:hypothetical protein
MTWSCPLQVQINFNDEEKLVKECLQGFRLGYTGEHHGLTLIAADDTYCKRAL